ncbi:hypothetical protein [Lysinibacillus sphaericus]|uniref:hypothetical protein n=1 Tax=Lysinibacillus sphaericus TaxID=1421 RepID=UPI00117F0148|nr:hypothetical protein [Lysinibacillus sphaericus]
MYEKSEPFVANDGTEGVITWWEDESGKEVGPRTCSECECAMYQGHVINDGDEYYCVTCIYKHYTSEQLNEMYENDAQYYTEWEESDLMDDFELVYEEQIS